MPDTSAGRIILPAFVFVTDVTKQACKASLRGIFAFSYQKIWKIQMDYVILRRFFRPKTENNITNINSSN